MHAKDQQTISNVWGVRQTSKFCCATKFSVSLTTLAEKNTQWLVEVWKDGVMKSSSLSCAAPQLRAEIVLCTLVQLKDWSIFSPFTSSVSHEKRWQRSTGFLVPLHFFRWLPALGAPKGTPETHWSGSLATALLGWCAGRKQSFDNSRDTRNRG